MTTNAVSKKIGSSKTGDINAMTMRLVTKLTTTGLACRNRASMSDKYDLLKLLTSPASEPTL